MEENENGHASRDVTTGTRVIVTNDVMWFIDPMTPVSLLGCAVNLSLQLSSLVQVCNRNCPYGTQSKPLKFCTNLLRCHIDSGYVVRNHWVERLRNHDKSRRKFHHSHQTHHSYISLNPVADYHIWFMITLVTLRQHKDECNTSDEP